MNDSQNRLAWYNPHDGHGTMVRDDGTRFGAALVATLRTERGRSTEPAVLIKPHFDEKHAPATANEPSGAARNAQEREGPGGSAPGVTVEHKGGCT